MTFGMPTLIELDSLEDSVALCKQLHLDFVELNMNLPQFQVERLEEIERLVSLKQKEGVFFTIHLDENLNVCDFNKAVSGAYFETVERTIEVAKKIGAPVLNMHMNHGVHFTLPDRKVQLFEKYNDDYMESWKKFRTMCEERIGGADVKICIENTEGFRSYEKQAVEFLLESGVFALTWDIGHSHATGNVDEGFIMAHEERLNHFHIHDGVGGKNHIALGTGEIDIQQRLGIAKRHNCRCVVETKTVESLKESVKWLERYKLL